MKENETVKLGPKLTKLLFIVLLGGITPFLDTTIVNVAISTLVKKLNSSVLIVQWVSTGYLLALAMAIPLTGWGAKRFGSKKMWMTSLTLFMVGSFLCGLSWNIQSLIIFRIIQGFGAGLMQPTMTTLLVQAASKEKRARLFITISNFAVIIPILGPTIGGLIINNFAWQWIFFFNVPVCLAALILAWQSIPSANFKEKNRLDFVGLFLLSPSLALIIYSLSQAGLHKSLGSMNFIFLAAGIVLFIGFIINSLSIKFEPIVDLRLFRSRTFSISGTLRFLSGLALFGATFLVPLYCQQILNMDALSAGLLLSFQGIGFILIRWLGKPIERLGPKLSILLGMVLVSAGTVAFTQSGIVASPLLLGLSLILRGTGLGTVNVAISIYAYQDLKHEDVPHGSSAIRIMQQVGGSFGVAVLAIILQSQSGHTGKAAAFNITFWWSIGFILVAFLLALLLPEIKPLKRDKLNEAEADN
jgi:EmrB/QacA subfamily drug resistance transporter